MQFRRSDAPKDSPPLVITTNRTARKPARVSVSPLAVSDAGEIKAAEEALIVNDKPTEFMDYLLLADFVYR